MQYRNLNGTGTGIFVSLNIGGATLLGAKCPFIEKEITKTCKNMRIGLPFASFSFWVDLLILEIPGY